MSVSTLLLTPLSATKEFCVSIPEEVAVLDPISLGHQGALTWTIWYLVTQMCSWSPFLWNGFQTSIIGLPSPNSFAREWTLRGVSSSRWKAERALGSGAPSQGVWFLRGWHWFSWHPPNSVMFFLLEILPWLVSWALLQAVFLKPRPMKGFEPRCPRGNADTERVRETLVRTPSSLAS